MFAPKSIMWRLLALFLTFGLFASACGSSGDGETSGTTGGDDSTQTDGTDAPTATDAVAGTIAPTPTDDTETAPVKGGVLRIGTTAEVNGVNPTTSSLSAPGLWMGISVYDTITANTPSGEVVPYLAESIEPNEDLTVWTVVLREGVTFHDGTPLNADALLVNFNSAYSNLLVGNAVKPFYPEEGGIVKVDDLTVEYHLLDPDANFPFSLTGQLGMVASPTWIEAAAADPALDQSPIGTGPFKLDSRALDDKTVFVRNDDWWGIGVVQDEIWLDAVEFYPVPDGDQRLDQLLAGDLDMMHGTDALSLPELQDASDAGDIQVQFDDQTEESFVMINTAVPPFDDIRARQALTYATPIEAYNEIITDNINRPANQMFTPDSPYFNPDIVQLNDMPELAGPLVDEYCAEKGTEINTVLDAPTCTDGKINMEFQYSGPSLVQDRIADLLRDEGWSEFFNVTFDQLFENDHIQQTALSAYNVVTWRQFGAVNPSRDKVWIMCRTINAISINWPRYCDEARDVLVLEGDSGVSEERFIEIQQEISQNLNEAFTYVFINHTIWQYGYSNDVHNLCGATSAEGDALLCLESGRTQLREMWLG